MTLRLAGEAQQPHLTSGSVPESILRKMAAPGANPESLQSWQGRGPALLPCGRRGRLRLLPEAYKNAGDSS